MRTEWLHRVRTKTKFVLCNVKSHFSLDNMNAPPSSNSIKRRKNSLSTDKTEHGFLGANEILNTAGARSSVLLRATWRLIDGCASPSWGEFIFPCREEDTAASTSQKQMSEGGYITVWMCGTSRSAGLSFYRVCPYPFPSSRKVSSRRAETAEQTLQKLAREMVVFRFSG